MNKLIIIHSYPTYPPTFGGALRCFYLMRELSNAFEVFLLTPQTPEELAITGSPPFPNSVKVYTFNKENKYRTIFNVLPDRIADAINSRILNLSVFKKGDQFLLQTYPTLRKLLRLNKPTFLMFETLDDYNSLSILVKKISPKTKQILDAHNVDSRLWTQLYDLNNDRNLLKYAAKALKAEQSLHKHLSFCLACSQEDKLNISGLNHGLLNVAVIPNGVDCEIKQFDSNPLKYRIVNLLFCATLDYGPNAEGIKWFAEAVMPLILKKIPSLTLTIIGKTHYPENWDWVYQSPGIQFFPNVEDVQPYYQKASVAVVPLLKGSGTRLKILEAMAFGTPVVSSVVGAEGLEVTHNENIIISSKEVDFANAVTSLLLDENLYNSIRFKARELVTHNYDWKVIGNKLRQYLD